MLGGRAVLEKKAERFKIENEDEHDGRAQNDLLEAIVALPLNMFYNTGIATYMWVLTSRKPPSNRPPTTRRKKLKPRRAKKGDANSDGPPKLIRTHESR